MPRKTPCEAPLYPLLYPPAKKFKRIWEYFGQRLRGVFTYENRGKGM